MKTQQKIKDTKGNTAQTTQRALVVFSGKTELTWLHMLRPGFRHCFVIIENTSQEGAAAWILYNPLSTGTQLAVWSSTNDETIRLWLVQQGYEVLVARAFPATERVFCWRPYTCVEAVKRLLGLHAPQVFTPWQLFRALKSKEAESNP